MSEEPQPHEKKSDVKRSSGAEGANDKISFLVCNTRFDVSSRYHLIKPIGHGAYGVVCSADDRTGQRKVAVKKISKAFTNVIETKRTYREIRLLRHFKHSNVISILDIIPPSSWEKFDDVYLVTDLMSTDLHQIINSQQPLSDDHVQYFVYQILRGLKYIHSANVLHRDLKPSNLLLNANCDLKICDFGLARVASADDSSKGFLTEYVATRWYRAPEIMLSWKEYTKAVDVWAVGCIMAEILGRKPLFPGKDYLHQLHLIIDILGTPSYEDTEYIASPKAKSYVRSLPFKKKIPLRKIYPHASDLAIDFLEKLLQFSPEKRITVDEALKHPYMSSLHDPTDEPICESPFSFDFEYEPMTQDHIKALLWAEAAHFHPHLNSLPVPEIAFAGWNQVTGASVPPSSSTQMEESF